jgi:hypothetical protein
MKILKIFLVLTFLFMFSLSVLASDYLVTKMSHNEAGRILRELLPNAKVVGVEGDNFDIVPINEIEKILLKNDTDSLSLRDSGDYVMCLIGVFSRFHNKIPFGFIKTDKEILNITIAKGFDSSGRHKNFVYIINPKTDEVKKLTRKAKEVRFAIIF